MNPQLENGHTRIANEILDALARTRIPGNCRRIVDVILRMTYGYSRKQAVITIKMFYHKTGLQKPNIVRNIKKLQKMNIIIRADRGRNSYYSFNKNYATWGKAPSAPTPATSKKKPAKKRGKLKKRAASPGDKLKNLWADIEKDYSEVYDLFKSCIEMFAGNNKSGRISESRELRVLERLLKIHKDKKFAFNGAEYELSYSVFVEGIETIIDKEIDNLNYARKIWIDRITKKSGGASAPVDLDKERENVFGKGDSPF